MKTKEIIETIQSPTAPPLDRVQASALLLHDYHCLDRRTYKSVYDDLVRVPDGVLQLAARILMHFTEQMAASQPASTPAPQPTEKPKHKQPHPWTDGGKKKQKSVRDLVLAADPDAPGFKPITGKGTTGLLFVTIDQYNRTRFRAQVNWPDFKFFKGPFDDKVAAQKTALRAARKFLRARKG